MINPYMQRWESEEVIRRRRNKTQRKYEWIARNRERHRLSQLKGSREHYYKVRRIITKEIRTSMLTTLASGNERNHESRRKRKTIQVSA